MDRPQQLPPGLVCSAPPVQPWWNTSDRLNSLPRYIGAPETVRGIRVDTIRAWLNASHASETRVAARVGSHGANGRSAERATQQPLPAGIVSRFGRWGWGALGVTDTLPRATVVIPVHVRERTLFEHALPSALRQQGVDIEVVVVCDGSPDALVRRVETYPDRRVTMIRHPTACGVARARNAGIEAATTEWVAILDDDDLWAPTKVAEQIAAAEHVGAGFAYSAAVIVDDRFRIKSLTPAPDPDTLLVDLLATNVIPGGGSNIIARRDLLQAVGGFDTRLWYMSDWEVAIALADVSTGAAVDSPLVAWVRHEGATAPTSAKAQQDIAHLRAKHGELSRLYDVRFDEATTLFWVGNSELETGRPGHRLRAARAFAREAWIGRRPSHIVNVGRAIIGGRANMALRDRLKHRPPRPDWLVEFSTNVHDPVGYVNELTTGREGARR